MTVRYKHSSEVIRLLAYDQVGQFANFRNLWHLCSGVPVPTERPRAVPPNLRDRQSHGETFACMANSLHKRLSLVGMEKAEKILEGGDKKEFSIDNLLASVRPAIKGGRDRDDNGSEAASNERLASSAYEEGKTFPKVKLDDLSGAGPHTASREASPRGKRVSFPIGDEEDKIIEKRPTSPGEMRKVKNLLKMNGIKVPEGQQKVEAGGRKSSINLQIPGADYPGASPGRGRESPTRKISGGGRRGSITMQIPGDRSQLIICLQQVHLT